MLRKNRLNILSTLTFCFVLSACGGGGASADGILQNATQNNSPNTSQDDGSQDDGADDAQDDSADDAQDDGADDSQDDGADDSQDDSSDDSTTTTAQMSQSGDWSNSTTWVNGALPNDGAVFTIPAGMTLTLDGEISQKLKTITIEGKLKFAADVNTALFVETIKSTHMGEFEIGTQNNPVGHGVTAQVVFADFGAIDRNADPQQISRGAVLMGPTTMWGSEKTAWAVVAEHPRAGDSIIDLTSIPVGWQVGDRLVVAATLADDPTGDEVATIESIDGTRITLTMPLGKDHIGFKADLDVHVANLSRNIVFISENNAIGRRGHVMFMHNLKVNVNYARFDKLGRTDKTIPLDDYTWPELDDAPPFQLENNNPRGRYSVHFHRGGVAVDSQPAIVKGSVVEDNPGWAFVNHSSNVNFIDNVSYNVVGGAFQTEAGDEMGAFIGNIALRTINPNDPMNCKCEQAIIDFREDRQDFSFQGDGFWLHGGGVSVEDNVVAGATGHAYVYWPEGLIEMLDGQSVMTRIEPARFPNNHLLNTSSKIDVWYFPVKSFKGNVGYNATKGLEFYYLHAHNFFTGNQEPVTEEYVAQLSSSFEDITLWNVKEHALGFNYTERVKFKNVRLVGNGDVSRKGLSAGHFHNLTSYTFENFTIEGYGVGMDMPTQGDIVVEGGRFANKIDFNIENPQTAPRNLLFKDIEFVGSDYFTQNERINFNMAPNFTLAGRIHGEDTRGHALKNLLFFLMPDRITLDFGEYRDMGLYYDEQRPDFIPMTTENANVELDEEEPIVVPPEAVNKTNQQLKDEFELYFGGAFIPDDGVNIPEVVGGKVGSKAADAVVFPPEL